MVQISFAQSFCFNFRTFVAFSDFLLLSNFSLQILCCKLSGTTQKELYTNLDEMATATCAGLADHGGIDRGDDKGKGYGYKIAVRKNSRGQRNCRTICAGVPRNAGTYSIFFGQKGSINSCL